MVGLLPLAPHHNSLQYIHHVHLMQRGQNRGVTRSHFVELGATMILVLLVPPVPLGVSFGATDSNPYALGSTLNATSSLHHLVVVGRYLC